MDIDLDTARRQFHATPFVHDVGIEPVALSPGRVSAELVLAPRHLQHTGQVHAGVSSTMADHCMGAAAQTMAAARQWATTAEFNLSLLRPARGERLVCVAQVLKPGRQLTFTEAEVYVVNGAERALVAKASATMALVGGA